MFRFIAVPAVETLQVIRPPQRTRKWITKNGTVELDPDPHVLPRYQHGSDLYRHRRLKLARKPAAIRKKTTRSRVKRLLPPPEGWRS